MAGIVAISHKGEEPKIGMTMRQPGLGKLEWIKEDSAKREKEEKKAEREGLREAKESKGKLKNGCAGCLTLIVIVVVLGWI